MAVLYLDKWGDFVKYRYATNGVCASGVEFDIEGNKLKNVTFVGGCDGNHKGISALAEGMSLEEAKERLRGITCGFRKTSCPDQLSKAIEEYISNSN